MKFAFRKKEIQEIARLRWLSEEQHTRVALITGPDGIGKKSLVQEALKGQHLSHTPNTLFLSWKMHLV